MKMVEDIDYMLRSIATFQSTTGMKLLLSLDIKHYSNPLRVFFVEGVFLLSGAVANTHNDAPTAHIPVRVVVIINKHLQGERDLLLCQDELIESGYGEWARL